MMSEENIYASPESNPEVADATAPSNVLASRLSRLGASILDSLIIMVVILPIAFATGYLTDVTSGIGPSIMYQVVFAILSIVIFLVINFKPLLSNGQTVGKKIVGIKIVTLDGGQINIETILKRYGFYFLVGYIPFIGSIVSLINILFIFGKDKHCLHDKVGKTKVVKRA
jgi:uncharacterized RDD family membrane protein YckC